MASLPTEAELKDNLQRAHGKIVPGNITSRNAFINIYGKYFTRFARRNQSKMPYRTRQTAQAISKNLIEQYKRETNNSAQRSLEKRIRNLGYTPPEIVPAPVAGPRNPVQDSAQEQIMQKLETAMSLNNKQFINAWKKYRTEIPNPEFTNKVRLREAYSRVGNLQKTRRQRYINLNEAIFRLPSRNEDREAKLETIAQNLRNLGGLVPLRKTGMGGGSAPPPRQLPKQPFRFQLPSLGFGTRRQPLVEEQGSLRKFQFTNSSGPYNFNRFVRNYKNYRTNPSSFTGVDKRKLAEVLDEFRRSKLGEYVVRGNVSLQNQLANLGLNKTYINKRRALKKRELALPALADAVRGNQPNVQTVQEAYAAYEPYAQFGNFSRSNVRRAKSILNPSNSWSKKAQLMVREAVTSYNRQIRQLEKNRDELPNTNDAGRTNISRRINALKRAKGLANVRKAAALRALQTTGKGLAAVAALPLAVTGGVLYGGYRGAQAGVRAGKARYASYTSEQARRRGLNAEAQRMFNVGEQPANNANQYLKNAYKKLRAREAERLAQEYVNRGNVPPAGTRANVVNAYGKLMRVKARKNQLKGAIKAVGTAFKKIKGKGMQKYEDELEQVLRNIANTRGKLNEIGPLFPINSQIARINQEIQTLPEGPGNNRNRLESNKQKLVNKKTKHTQLHSNAKELLKRKQELETILKRMQISKAGQVGILRKVYQRTQEYEAQKAGLNENLDKVAKQLERLNLAGSNRDKLEKRQREIKVRMAQLNRLIAKRNRPPPIRPQVPPQGLFSTMGAAPQTASRSGLAPALSTRGVPVNRMTNFSIKYEETSDERIKAQIIQQAYKLASDNMKKARTETELEEMYAQYRTLGPDSRRFKDLLDMGYKSIKARIKSKRENRGNLGRLFGGGSGNLGKLLGSESTRKILQELPTAQREAVRNAGGIARASSLIENAGGPNVVTRAAEVLKKSGGNVERAALNTPNIPVRAFQNVKKLGGPSTAVRTVRVVQVVKTRVRRRKTPVKKPRRVPTRKTKKKKKTSVATLKKIVHKLPRRNLEREALKWLSR